MADDQQECTCEAMEALAVSHVFLMRENCSQLGVPKTPVANLKATVRVEKEKF